jgi:hypothetical protein
MVRQSVACKGKIIISGKANAFSPETEYFRLTRSFFFQQPRYCRGMTGILC